MLVVGPVPGGPLFATGGGRFRLEATHFQVSGSGQLSLGPGAWLRQLHLWSGLENIVWCYMFVHIFAISQSYSDFALMDGKRFCLGR